MARPLRIEFPGALYHVTSRGDRQEPIYEDDDDRQMFLSILGEVVKEWNWLCYAYCLMSNHYHLLMETPDGNLSKGMRQLNGVYTQRSNRRHGRVGHLFQGRYKAILVDSDTYLLELSRYIILNPVRAGMVETPEAWPWSSFKAMVGQEMSPEWLAADGLLAHFAQRQAVARQRYRQFVMEGVGQPSIWQDLNRQIFLGDDGFVSRMQAHLDGEPLDVNIPKVQRRAPAKPLEEIAAGCRDRNEAIIAAYATGEFSYQQLADYFEVHFTTVGRIVRSSRGK
ncbi:REP-associated tyrosine transposase [Candidatus Entotheonella palauensis]|uniref:Toxin RelE n=1 Tax=Candidatus Entotheonella gemina TaxID=1429439 RepID=W4LR74_9BACT|nr:transposase [Candidatus Entotheonella palauensis]ETX00569.1 MAG: toxin RelE [Candidatus Entotheonella gemina]